MYLCGRCRINSDFSVFLYLIKLFKKQIFDEWMAAKMEGHSSRGIEARRHDASRCYTAADREAFGALWCESEIPEDRSGADPSTWRTYRPLPGGWKITMQQRIIFSVVMFGRYHGWQARIPQIDHEGMRYYCHPYSMRWEA